MLLPALPQAAILQQTAEYIFSLEQEKTRLLQQNTQLKRFIQVAPACARQGREGMGQSWLAGEGTLLLFLGVRVRPSSLRSWGMETFRTLLAGQRSPVQRSIPYLAGGEGLGSHFPFGVSGCGLVAAPALGWAS